MGVGEVDAAFGQAIDVWGDGDGCCVVAPDPVVHVIDRKEQDIGSLGSFNGENRLNQHHGYDCCEQEVFHLTFKWWMGSYYVDRRN